ncbi:MAG: ABC transporter ATP-binding protein [Acidobacteriota bacterium]|nr:ABC transporter ATP-binding protein [Acidobacteriota bacterium]
MDGLSFEVPHGVIFGLLGPNGAGKTTTLRILTTLVAPTSGHVRVAGHDPARDGFAVRGSIAAVLQDNASEQFLSVRDNFLCYARLHGQDRAETGRRLPEIAERFGLSEELGEKAADLSIGMRRRVQVAKVFLVDAPILFLDEATTGMDPFVKRIVLDGIRDSVRGGRTVVLTTQNLDEAERLCDEVLIMAHGKAIARGAVSAVTSLYAPAVEIRVSFDEAPVGLDEFLAPYHPVSSAFAAGRLTARLSGSRRDAARFLGALADRYRVADFEVESASLEDAFLEIVRRSREETP